MPKKLERCRKKVQAKGNSKSSAYAICQAAMNKGKKNGRKKRKN